MDPRGVAASGSPSGRQQDHGGGEQDASKDASKDTADHQPTTNEPLECIQMDKQAEFDRINAYLVRAKAPDDVLRSLDELRRSFAQLRNTLPRITNSTGSYQAAIR
jgi:hypothetical protein